MHRSGYNSVDDLIHFQLVYGLSNIVFTLYRGTNPYSEVKF